MRFELSTIEKSKRDLIRGLKFPRTLNEDLAEFLGIMVGDGHLGFYPRLNKKGKINSIGRDIRIACNKKEGGYIRYIMRLFYSLFKIKIRWKQDTKPNSIILCAYSKGILNFLNKSCGIPLNRKAGIVTVPHIIKIADDKSKCAFLRGLADTDFSVCFKNKTKKGHSYPVIKGCFKSKNLIKDLEVLFRDLKFRYCTCYDILMYDGRFTSVIMHSIYLNGKDNLKKWVDKIWFSNPKFKNKVNKWLKDGVCPPGYH